MSVTGRAGVAATAPESAAAAGVPLGRLVLGLVLAVLTVATIEVASLLVLAAVDLLSGSHSGTVATLVLDAGTVLAWLVAGGLAYEVVREPSAVGVVAALPLVGALLAALARLNGAQFLVRGGAMGAILFALVLGLVTLLGGWLWARHLRPSTPVD